MQHSVHWNSLLRWKPCKDCRGATCDIMQQSAGVSLCMHAQTLSVPQLSVSVLSPFCSFVTFHSSYSLCSNHSHRLQADRPRKRFPTQLTRRFSFSTYRVWGSPSFPHTGYHTQSSRSLNLVPAIPTIHHTPSWCGVYLHTGENSHSYFCLDGVLAQSGFWFHSSPFTPTQRRLSRETRRKGGISRHGINGKIILKLILTNWVGGYGLQ